MRTRIGTQVIAGVALVTALVIGVSAVAVLRAQRSQLVRELTRGVDQISETIKSSTHWDMLENRRDDLHRQIQTIGDQEGIERVRIFNKDGRISFSSVDTEIGQALDKDAEACFACHAAGAPLERLPIQERARTFSTPGGERVLAIINPIYNEPSCATAACHAHPAAARVLGVLDVHVPLAEVDAQIAANQRSMFWLALLAVGAGSLLLWWLNRRLVVVPTRAILAGTRRVARGDLSTSIPVTARHELGELAGSFNEMTAKLAEAQRQLAQSDKLASLGRLAAGVAHEINNPLTGVLTYASYLHKRCESDPDLKNDLEVIVRETKRCREIVRGLLDFARQKPSRREAVDVNAVVRNASVVIMSQLSLHRIALSLDLAADLAPVEGDPNQLQQVVTNLLLNAADAVDGTAGGIRVHSRNAHLPAWGNAAVRAAACPKGCDLIDTTVRIGGLPSIRVARTQGGTEAIVHLDPVYGRSNHVTSEPCEDGVVASYACPRCRRSLAPQDPGWTTCGTCGAAAYAVQVTGRGEVAWCTRKGCSWSFWGAEEAEGARPVVEIAVEDQGRGIRPQDLARLFEPFFTTKGGRGTGLGLAVSWGIVEAHCGTIHVESSEGQGSRFTVRLPRAANADRVPEPAAA